MKYYSNCGELPLYRFIKIMCNGDLKNLIISGVVPEDKLSVAWADITAEYAELSHDNSQTAMLSLVKEITVLNNKLMLIQCAVDEMARLYSLDLANWLREQGFRFEYNPQDPESYLADLKRTVSSAKPMLIKLKERQNEFDQNKPKEGKENTEFEYDVYLATLSKFQGHRIDPKLCTVSEFIAITNNFKREIELMRKNGR